MNKKNKKAHYTILTCFTNYAKFLLNFFMIILHQYLKQNLKHFKEKYLKYLTPKQILERLPIALAHVKPSNASDSL